MGQLDPVKCIDCETLVKPSEDAYQHYLTLLAICKAKGWAPIRLDLVCDACAVPWRERQKQRYQEEFQILRDFEAGKVNEWDIPHDIRSRNEGLIRSYQAVSRIKQMGREGKLA